METDDFEWDDHKARANFDKHDVSFEAATFAFDDTDTIEYPDETEDYGEERWVISSVHHAGAQDPHHLSQEARPR